MEKSESSSGKTTIVEVPFNQQQYVILEKLRAEKTFGTEDGEIIRRIFQEFVKQEGH
jgi:hypothetical protein